MSLRIITVKGPIAPGDMGVTLPHEHIMCDFVGADQTGSHRWDQTEVVTAMERHVQEIADLGVSSFVDCSPMYIGRDPEVLRGISDLTGVHILTNTGMYKEPFLPQYAFDVEAEELAADWIREALAGSEGTGILPGFIKTAVERTTLAPMQRKITTAAAITAAQTGLSIATHTGVAVAAEEILQILEHRGVGPERWIFVHAQNEEDLDALVEIARRGAWIELDGLSPSSADKHLLALERLLEEGFENQVLLSHDAGWYSVGEPGGGEVRPYAFLFTDFLPLLRRRGVSDRTIQTITAVNPSRAFSVERKEQS